LLQINLKCIMYCKDSYISKKYFYFKQILFYLKIVKTEKLYQSFHKNITQRNCFQLIFKKWNKSAY